MNPPPTDSAAVLRSREWRVALGVTLAALLVAFAGVGRELVALWTAKADYSHGFLVVPFVGYLLWTRRDLFPERIHWPNPLGLVPMGVALALMVVAERYNIAREFTQAVALVLALAGVLVMFCGGLASLRWAWPGLGFLAFAFPLPHTIEARLSNRLQTFATDAGNFTFQTLGLPSYSRGNVIVIGETVLGVDRACSGLSMLLAFVALTGAMAILARSKPAVDRVMIFASAIPIALLCNVVRITVTGLVYHAGYRRLGDAIVHDLAGWLMMPMALALLWIELRLLNWVVEPVDNLSTVEALGLPGRPPGAPLGRPS